MSSTIHMADCSTSGGCENKMAGISGTDVLQVTIGLGLVATWLVVLPLALWSAVIEPTGKARGLVWATIVVAFPFLGAIAFWSRSRWLQQHASTATVK